MAESSVFILIVGFLIIGIFYVFDIQWVDPRVVIGLLALLLLPGFYAAIKSGPFVPSDRKRHKKMIELAGITEKDVVYDLGCGDGRLVFSASKFAKKAIGYDLSIPLIVFGKLASLFYPRASIHFGNIWTKDYQDANVIFCYLLPKAMKEFYERVWPTLQPGTRVISNAFMIHELQPQNKEGKVYLYIR